MAKIALSALVNAIRGKIGTVVFTEASNGPTARIKAMVKNPKSTAQRAVRDYFSKAARTFKGLTDPQGNAWETYGAAQVRHNPVTGETYSLSGVAAFIELASKFLQVNPSGTIPVTPPAAEFVGDSITLTATAGTGIVTFTASAANAIGITTEMLIQPLKSTHRKPNPDGYKHAAFKAFAVGNLTQVVNLTTGYYSVAYRFVKTSTGQATDPIVLPLQVVALSVADGGAGEAHDSVTLPAAKKKAA